MARVGSCSELRHIDGAIPSDQIFHLEANGDCLYNLNVFRDFFTSKTSRGMGAVFIAACPELGVERTYYCHNDIDSAEYYANSYKYGDADLTAYYMQTCVFLAKRFILAELRDAAARAVQLERIATKKKAPTVAVDTAEKTVILDKADVEAYTVSLNEEAEEKPQRSKADGSMNAYKY